LRYLHPKVWGEAVTLEARDGRAQGVGDLADFEMGFWQWAGGSDE